MKKTLTFNDLHLKYEDLFNVTPIVGIHMQTSKYISDRTNCNLNLAFHPTELVPIQTPDGPQYALMRPLRTINFSSKTSFNYFDISTILASNLNLIAISTNPTENINLNLKFEKKSRLNLRPTLSTYFIYPKIAITLQLQTADYKRITSTDFNFSLLNKLCFQFVQRKKGDHNQYGYALFSCFNISKTSVSLSLLHDVETYFVIRSLTKIKDNVTAGVKYTINQNLFSNITVGYKMKINNFLIHSTIDANGTVKSYFDREVNDKFHFIMSSSLYHPEKSYHFGVGLSWIYPKDDSG